MITQLEQDLKSTAERYKLQQREIRRIIAEKTASERALVIKKLEGIMRLALTDKQKQSLGLTFEFSEDGDSKIVGRHHQLPYYVHLTEFNGGEVGWRIIFFNENGDECRSAIPFEILYQELIKVLMRYDNMPQQVKDSLIEEE